MQYNANLLVDGSRADSSPFAYRPTAKSRSEIPQSQPSAIENGYTSKNNPPIHFEAPFIPIGRIPNSLGDTVDTPISPKSPEEQILEKQEKLTEKQQARDLKIKTRARVVKMLLRGVSFSCSLIVLAMMSTALHIFFATQHLPERNNLPAWATGTQTWPQYVVLTTSCVSLAFCLMIFYSYWRGGHRRAEKTAVYQTIFAVGLFIFSLVMWGIAAGILQGSKNSSGNRDIWGWSCVDNKRRQLFREKVDYALVCKLQSWSLICCIIEVVIDFITISIYGIIFYRYYSKRQLRKSMDARDRARSDLYLAQLRPQAVPDIQKAGFLSRSYSSYTNSPRLPPTSDAKFSDAQEGFAYFVGDKATSKHPKPPGVHAATEQAGFLTQPGILSENRIEHTLVVPGEQTYDPVPIPGAYVSNEQQIPRSGLYGQAVSRHWVSNYIRYD